MTLDAGILQSLTTGTPKDAWRVIVDQAIEIASKPLAAGNAPSEVTKRDREIGTLDHFLSSSGWDLWQAFGQPEISGIERTSAGTLVVRAGICGQWRQGGADPRRSVAAGTAVAAARRKGAWLRLARGQRQRVRIAGRNQRVCPRIGFW